MKVLWVLEFLMVPQTVSSGLEFTGVVAACRWQGPPSSAKELHDIGFVINAPTTSSLALRVPLC